MDKEKWIDEVLVSMKGSQKAKPSLELFEKINNKIKASRAKTLTIYQWRFAAAAVALILLMNISALVLYTPQNVVASSDELTSVADSYSQSLISSYQIYE